MNYARYNRFVINGQRVFPSYNIFGESIWDRPINGPYCQAGEPCLNLLDCGQGYCSSTGVCSAAKPTVAAGQFISPSFVR